MSGALLTVSDLHSVSSFKEYAFKIISYELDTGQILTHFYSEYSCVLTETLIFLTLAF